MATYTTNLHLIKPALTDVASIADINGNMDALDAVISNRNLLDNWDFRIPVNQRGVSGTISTAGYFLDRWILVSGSVTVGMGSITLNGSIKQISETAWGTNVTASVRTHSGTASIAYNDGTRTTTITSSGGVILAAKLEAGSVSTLANDPPMDIATELVKCKRFFRIASEAVSMVYYPYATIVVSIDAANMAAIYPTLTVDSAIKVGTSNNALNAAMYGGSGLIRVDVTDPAPVGTGFLITGLKISAEPL